MGTEEEVGTGPIVEGVEGLERGRVEGVSTEGVCWVWLGETGKVEGSERRALMMPNAEARLGCVVANEVRELESESEWRSRRCASSRSQRSGMVWC